jgi:hypothetical protein
MLPRAGRNCHRPTQGRRPGPASIALRRATVRQRHRPPRNAPHAERGLQAAQQLEAQAARRARSPRRKIIFSPVSRSSSRMCSSSCSGVIGLKSRSRYGSSNGSRSAAASIRAPSSSSVISKCRISRGIGSQRRGARSWRVRFLIPLSIRACGFPAHGLPMIFLMVTTRIPGSERCRAGGRDLVPRTTRASSPSTGPVVGCVRNACTSGYGGDRRRIGPVG